MRKILSSIFFIIFFLFDHSIKAQNIGIGTNTPKAALDVTSTTNGFLPPRITGQQRDAIVNPVAGLIIYCTNCGDGEMQYYNGSSWRSMNMGTALNPTTSNGFTIHSCGANNVHNSSVEYGSMTDQESNVYRTVKIGAQTWMAENLKVTKFRNNISIANLTSNTQWLEQQSVGGTAAYCNYDNNISNDCPYGKLYNWFAVVSSNNLCPLGWHVPTRSEWETLSTFLGDGASVEGGAMKSTGTQYWLNPNQNATNSSGFSGLPGGYRSNLSLFEFIGSGGFWWTVTPENANSLAYYYQLSNNTLFLSANLADRRYGFSVRCVKD